MEIQIFWNKAIEYHCLKNSNETIFIAVSEDSLEDIYNNYFLQLNELNSKVVQVTIKSFGGIKASYFEALKKVFFNTNEGAFCFLKFSIFVLSAFELNTTNGYWGNFDKKLLSNINQTLNPYRRTDFIDSVIDNLKKFCRNQNTVKKYDWNGEKIFLDLNIYGNNTNRINVGRIYAHSIFTASTINNVKKAMYELGIAYSGAIEYLTDEEIKKIIKKAGLLRLDNLFELADVNGLINECLSIFLKDWEPTEIEERSYSINKYEKISSPLSRIWVWEKYLPKKEFEWIYGFISKKDFGAEGRILLNEPKNIYINLDRSSKIGSNYFLYIIENLNPEFDCILDNKEYNLSFANPNIYEGTCCALKHIKNTYYYLQINKSKVLFSNEAVFLASEKKLDKIDSSYCGNFSIRYINKDFFVYRIQKSIELANYSFVRVNNEFNIEFRGITSGIQRQASFLFSYPVQIYIGNIENGNLEIYDSKEKLIKSYNLSNEHYKLESLIQLKNLDIGEYFVRVKLEDNEYVTFNNGNIQKEFRIIEEGMEDRREHLIHENQNSFEYRKFDDPVQVKDLNPNWILIFDNNNGVINTTELNHRLFDFCFRKDIYNEWFITHNRSLFFGAILKTATIPDKIDGVTCQGEVFRCIYKDTNLMDYEFKVKHTCKNNLSIKINPELYNSNYFQTRTNILLNFYSFELIELDDGLSNKYSQIQPGSTISILTNYSDNAEILFKTITQEIFPFKLSII